MRKNVLILSFTFLLLGVLGSCKSDYRAMVKKAKSNQIADKDTAAVWFYKHKKYDRAAPLLEELVPIVAGTERQPELYYYYCWSRYMLGEMVSSAYYFEDYANKFPNNEHSEECQYMVAKCYYQISDPFYLDQSYTDKALNEMQLFLSRNPYTDKKEKCMDIINELRERKAKKAFEQASLYYNISYFKAAVAAFTNMINEFPDSDYREEAQFMIFKSAYALAEVSTNRKKIGRYNEALEHQEKFSAKFPESDFSVESNEMVSNSERNLSKLKLEKKKREEEGLYLKFKTSIQRVLSSKDDSVKEESYNKALATYKQLESDFPGSPFLSDADKWLRKVDQKTNQE